MNNKKRRGILQACLVLLLILAHQILFFGISVIEANANSTYASTGRMIDLFTQKEPYSGKGINKSSDAFSPRLESEVILYANVTYNEEPLEYFQVAFQVESPKPLPGFPLLTSAFTNTSGIATISFRLRQAGYAEEDVFGNWFAVATVEIAGTIVRDTLTFKVGYIVEIVSLATIDENRNPKSYFSKATCVGVELHIRNIAMLPRTATIVVTAYDRQNNSFGSIIWNDFDLEPGLNHFFAYCFLNISKQAEIGNAAINATVLTAPPSMGGVPYCPEVSAKFVITSRDVAVVNVTVSSIDVISGEVVNITVTVKNKGNETETFLVNAFYGPFQIQTPRLVESLSPNQNRTITFVWNTTYVPAGSYIITAVAQTVPGETETEDNTARARVTVRMPRIFMFPRDLSFVALVVAAALAFFAIILLTRRRRSAPLSVMLSVDVLPS